MRLLTAILLASIPSCSALGQTYTISTVAGRLPINILGVSANLGGVPYMAVDPAGNVFIRSFNMVLRLDATTNVLTAVAGNGTYGSSGDNGLATSAQVGGYYGLAVDTSGNLYIEDDGSNSLLIRKVSNGIITTVAGGGSSLAENVPATSAKLGLFLHLAVGPDGSLYIAEYLNNRIRRISNGIITTIAGNGTQGYSGDNGPAIKAQLSQPIGIAVDSGGSVYVSDNGNRRVRRISNGVIATVAGTGIYGFSGDGGPATGAELSGAEGVTVDSAGNLYIADAGNMRIRKVSNEVITTVVGNGTPGFGGDNGLATNAQMATVETVGVDGVGNLYIADRYSGRIRRVSNGVITTVAGSNPCCFSGDNGPATSAQFGCPQGVAVDSAGNLYIADSANARVRKVSSGVITTVAGNGTISFGGDNGPATSAQLNNPFGVAVDTAGDLYIAETDGARIRKVSNGVITTVAGNGTHGYSGDNGPATSAELSIAEGVAVDTAGNLYIAEIDGARIRKVSNGVITTVAGGGSSLGDNGPAINALLSHPRGVAVDLAGNLYIADTGNSRVCKVSNGVITTVAGGGSSLGDNGRATSAQLNSPFGIAVDSTGNLYIADTGNRRIRKVSNGVITTIAGTGTPGISGDGGPATGAQLGTSSGIAVTATGNVYIADSETGLIRLLTPSGSPTLYITAVNSAASNLSGPIAPGEIVTITGSGLGPGAITSAHLGSDGLYDPQLAGTSVQFNGIAAPMIYASATQTAAIVPYEITGSSAQVTVTYQGQTSAPVTVAVSASAPGLFTLDSTGKGQAAAVNQNNSINGASAPAPIGSILSLYATGEGQTSPPGTDGKPGTATLPTPNLPVNATTRGVTVNNLQYEIGRAHV